MRPFLTNLFSDPAIIGLPAIVRRPLAAFIAARRERLAIANYAVMGGGSPIVKETQAQATALQTVLAARRPDAEIRTFIAMRYWAPDTRKAAAAVAAYSPDTIVLAPLYPQFSTTTTASSFKVWREIYNGRGEQHTLCCWYANAGLIEAHARAILRTWEEAGRPNVRLLFSAHGLPQRVADSGDPYPWQIEATCAAVAAKLGPGWDWRICYQSRVGPLRWLGPSTPQAIEAAADEGLGVLIDPVAFVSEHVETLVELDRDYADLARELGMSVYLRAPAVGVDAAFIEGLADAVEQTLARQAGVTGPQGEACPGAYGRCGRTRQAA